MVHAIAYIVFILPFTAWLRYELHIKTSLKTHWKWLAGAFFVGVLGNTFSNIFSGVGGNFILHASGGFASTLLFIYLLKTLRLSFNWRITLLLLVGFVSMLGVANELAEYTLELLGAGQYSFDTHDTWRDLVANTTGMLCAWILYCLSRTVISND
jgi:glucan phosphoethanolaminetransferase (alkaline phosphatase superfamily)